MTSSDAGAGRPRLKVLHVITPSRVSGAERIAVELCEGLKQRGHEVLVACKLFSPFPDFARDAGLECVELDIGGKLNLRAALRLARLVREREIDVIHTHLSTASLWGSIAGRLTRTPVIAHVQALNWSPCYLLADGVIACSEAVKRRIRGQGIPARKIRVVYNAIDVERFSRELSIDEAKHRLGFGADVIVAGVVAHLSRKKGQGYLMRAIAELSQRHPKLMLMLVGEGADRTMLTSLAESLCISERVRFTGYQSDVRPFLSAMDMLVLPSISTEGFGIVLAEAGALGVPAIGTSVGGADEVVANEVTGFIVLPRSVTPLAEAIDRLAQDPHLRREMGERGRKRVTALFTIDKMVSEVESVYMEHAANRCDSTSREHEVGSVGEFRGMSSSHIDRTAGEASAKLGRVLFVRLSSLGDVLDATPVAEAVKREHPGAHVGWVVDRRCAPLLAANPHIDRIHAWDPTVCGFLRLIKELRSVRYEVVVDAQGLLKSAVIGWASGAPKRFGPTDARENAGLFYTDNICVDRDFARVSERSLLLLQGIGVAVTPGEFPLTIQLATEDEESVGQWLQLHNLHERPFIVLGPSTTTPQRHWTPERWSELADRLSREYGIACAVLAGSRDRPLLDMIAAKARAPVVLSAGALDVRASCGVVGRASAVVTLDSFLLHAGLAMGTPTVALFGPTPTDRFSGEPGLTIVNKECSCHPCGRRPTCAGAFACMKMITVDDVLAAINLLN